MSGARVIPILEWMLMQVETHTHRQADSESVADRFSACMELGGHYLSAGRYVQARQCYRNAAQLRCDAAAHVGIGASALRMDSLDEAEQAYRKAVRMDPMCGPALNGLGTVAERRGCFDEAYEFYAQSLDRDGADAEALLGLFQMSCRTGRFEGALARFERTVSSGACPADKAVRFSLAVLYHKLGRLPDARKVLMEILSDSRDYSCAADLLEEVELRLGAES
ncbi:MAG TPA: tetratricopeptide repeat protein [Phycisphaerales bacterium]|nr:tetratricopeptide repeat protein [Phycisphaerales bacterium]